MQDKDLILQGHPEKLLNELSTMIEESKNQVAIHANSILTILFWKIGERINKHILSNKRAEYGKQIVVTLSRLLKERHGNSFEEKNLRRMLQFAEIFNNTEIVVTLSQQLSWSHIITILPLKKQEIRLFYAEKVSTERWSVRRLREEIRNKHFERKEIGNVQLAQKYQETKDIFKDHYLLHFLNLKDEFIEQDLENAILHDLEKFIMELGKGFTFVERQKRMIIDGDDYRLDLLFFHRKLKRLVAIELKIDKFRASYKGQMELYLKWLNKHERQEGEEKPIGLILCAETSQEQIELLEMHNDGIMVAEYWTELPEKQLLQDKLHQAYLEARERITRKQLK